MSLFLLALEFEVRYVLCLSRNEGLANVFLLLYSMSRVSVLVTCAGSKRTVTFLAQHKPQQVALALKNAKDGEGLLYILFLISSPAANTDWNHVFEEMLGFVFFLLWVSSTPLIQMVKTFQLILTDLISQK